MTMPDEEDVDLLGGEGSDPEVDALNEDLETAADLNGEMPDGYFRRHQDGDIRFHAAPERDLCGGMGIIHCYCGGDMCVCGNQGEIECDGCEDCERDDIDSGDEE